MNTTSVVAASLAATIHLWIFAMESLLWGSGLVNKIFRVRAEEAEANRLFAFNQGVYNLALAAMVFAGIGYGLAGARETGLALLCAGCGAMVVAAIALLISARHLWRAFLIQGVPAAVAIVSALL